MDGILPEGQIDPTGTPWTVTKLRQITRAPRVASIARQRAITGRTAASGGLPDLHPFDIELILRLQHGRDILSHGPDDHLILDRNIDHPAPHQHIPPLHHLPPLPPPHPSPP